MSKVAPMKWCKWLLEKARGDSGMVRIETRVVRLGSPPVPWSASFRPNGPLLPSGNPRSKWAGSSILVHETRPPSTGGLGCWSCQPRRQWGSIRHCVGCPARNVRTLVILTGHCLESLHSDSQSSVTCLSVQTFSSTPRPPQGSPP